MRIVGFSKKWNKLQQPEFTSFRLSRKDRDWEVGERVQIVYHPRQKDRERLGEAEIIKKEARAFKEVTESEAIEDGFENALSMWMWLKKVHKGIRMTDSLNKLTLRQEFPE